MGYRFGTVALTLQLVPVLSMLFLMTTATGAAMWAADLEKQRQRKLMEGQQPATPTVRTITSDHGRDALHA
jgi:hypothetical protein